MAPLLHRAAITKKSPFWHHRTTLSCCIFAVKACIDNRRKKLLRSNISSTCPCNMANVGPLTADICWRVWGTPANFNMFRVLASLLQQCHSTEVNQTLNNVWPSPGLVHYIYIFRGSCPQQNFALSYIGSVTAQHSSNEHQ